MLVSLSDAKTYLGVSGTDDDTFIQSRIAIISAAINSHCNRNLLSHSEEKYFGFVHGERELNKYLFLKDGPIISIDSVIENDVELVVEGETNFELVKSDLYRIASGCKVRWGREVKVQWTAGYALEDMPEVIKMVVCEVLKEKYLSYKDDSDSGFMNDDFTKVVIPGVVTTEKASNSEAIDLKMYPQASLLGTYVYLLDPFVVHGGVF